MFMCKECHKPDEQKGCPGHLSTSYGRCELCNAVTECVDCRFYKAQPRPSDLTKP